MGDAKQLRGIGGHGLEHHSQTADAFSGDHATHCQFHFCGRQSSVHGGSVSAQFRTPFEGSFQRSDLFTARVY
jgi:hypothetical protein